MIELRDVYLRRGSRTIVGGMTFSVPPGVTALVGRNGAGKTTLIRSLCGLLPPSRGTIFVDDVDLYSAGSQGRSLKSSIGWMPQEPVLPRRGRVREVVEYAAWMRGASPKELSASAEAAIDHVGLDGRRAIRIGKLSGGERRRAALACALVGHPRILVLDEPTVGLDPHQRNAFLTRIKSGAMTTILSTHLLEDVLEVADRVIAIDEGNLLREVSVTDLGESSTGNGSYRQFRDRLFGPERATD